MDLASYGRFYLLFSEIYKNMYFGLLERDVCLPRRPKYFFMSLLASGTVVEVTNFKVWVSTLLAKQIL